MRVKIHGNHALRHRNNEETQAGRFGNPQAYINRSRDKNSCAKSPSRYHSQAGKNSGRICSP